MAHTCNQEHGEIGRILRIKVVLRLATDEDFNNRILRGLLRRRPELDIVRVQDAGLRGEDDAAVLEWAAGEGASCSRMM
jgi:hypothetical protein